MRAIVARVSEAAVHVDGRRLASIGAGLLVLVGVTHTDGPEQAAKLATKVAGLRILRDGDRDEAAAGSVGASALVVSQFTLYGDTSSGRRPSWQQAAPGPVAEPLIAAFVQRLRTAGVAVQTGRFGALMAVSSVNDGPFTLMLEV